MLKAILKLYVDAQWLTIHGVEVRFGDKTKILNLKVPCFFIIGDMQCGDKLCACAPVYFNTMNRLCHKCDISGKDAGNPDAQCHKIVMAGIQQMVNLKHHDELDMLNMSMMHGLMLISADVPMEFSVRPVQSSHFMPSRMAWYQPVFPFCSRKLSKNLPYLQNLTH